MQGQTTNNRQHALIQTGPVRAVLFIAVINLAGIIGLNLTSTENLFRFLTPFTLIAITAILVVFHPRWNRRFVLFTILTSCIGLTAEIIGVNTGLIFGSYQYGTTLGWKLMNTPVIIAVNWLMLGYLGTTLSMKINGPVGLRVLTGAGLMVLLDVFMEPVAEKYDFWSWDSGSVPALNYIGWFVLSSIIVYLGIKLKVNSGNPVTIPVYFIQLIFFLTLNILNHL
jgi:bisanhydrobacterioruberin hydratase